MGMLWLVSLGLLVMGSAGLAPLLAEKSYTRIPGSWLVQFKPHTPLGDRRAHMGRLPEGLTLKKEWDFNSFHGYHVECKEDECLRILQKVREDKDVLHVEADQVVEAWGVAPNNATKACQCQDNAPSWGMARVSRRSSTPTTRGYPFESTGGSGKSVCILDTGIRISNSDFGGRAEYGYTAYGSNANDNHGHGTHVAGTVGSNTYGLAKAVRLYAVKVLSDSGSGSTAGIVSGCEWSSNRCEVSNLSLGGGASSTMDNAVNAMNGQVVVAAGNDGRDACSYSPARATGAITVGSTTSSDGVSSFSNHGSCLNGWAPGSSITSNGLNSGSSATMSGTSMASPHVAGALAVGGQWLPNIISRTGSPSQFIYTPDCPNAC